MKLTEITDQDKHILKMKQVLSDANKIVFDGEFDVDPQTYVVSVRGNVELVADIIEGGRTKIVFGTVSGYFDATGLPQLTSLEGCPPEIGGQFSIYDTGVTSLVGGPHVVGGGYSAYNTNITSLEGMPAEVGRMVHLGACKSLRSLTHLPMKIGFASKDPAFGGLVISDTGVRSLHNFHRTHKGLQINGMLTIDPAMTHLLSLLMIPGVRVVYSTDGQLNTILNKHLRGDRDVNLCQEELIDAGYHAQARI